MEDTEDKGILKFFGKKSTNDKKKPFNKRDWERGPKISTATDEFYYDNTTNKSIGFALVFNQVHIKGFKERKGSDLDTQRITNALKEYGFKVEVFRDFTKKEIFNILYSYAQKDHLENDCFVVVVMSHGKKEEIYAADDSYRVDELWEPFLGDNCASLVNKPKLFFIQCCRGNKLDQGTQYHTDTIDNSTNSSELVTAIDEPFSYHIPHTADLLIYYSTFKNYSAWRHPMKGSVFIESLAQILSLASRNDEANELYFLLTKVSSMVAYQFQTIHPYEEKYNAKKQMPCIESTLTKMFLIRPKNEKNNL